MRKDLLLEIGTEEIPARFMPGILTQLKALTKDKLTELRIGFSDISTMGTPRRIALCVTDVEAKQSDFSSENKGPSVKVAFDEAGNPTKACLGFARGQKVDANDLVTKDGYVYAMVQENGQATVTLLESVLPELIGNLNFPKNMRWADLDMRFVRPIKWLVALFGTDIVKFSVAGVETGNVSRGHRFLSSGDIVVADAQSYEKAMRDNFVIVDQVKREEIIRCQIEALAAEKGGRADITDELLEEVVFLVEYPTALCGSFEEKYLKLPPETVITPMREHQRYFPVLSAEGKLLPLFITVRNGGRDHIDIVQHGNERVLRARLADAQFFFEEDCKVKLIDRLEKLKTVVFQERLGTIYDKAMRLAKIAEFLQGEIELKEIQTDDLVRCAHLAKTDLVTGMVCEFTELQGIMGRAYALLSGEKEAVANAIYEHYLPRFAGDDLPKTALGRLVSIADKIDNIVATFSRGLVPTGSQDPYALRRQALGIVNIILDSKTNISLSKVVIAVLDLLQISDAEKRQKVVSDVEEFFRLRIKNVLTDKKIRYDIVDAVLAVGIDDLYASYLRAQALASQVDKPELTKAVQAFVRVGNLAKKAGDVQICPDLFKVAEERALYEIYTSTASAVESLLEGKDYVGALETMGDMADAIDAFFASVMVMDKDEAVKNNRLALLKSIMAMVSRVADLSKII